MADVLTRPDPRDSSELTPTTRILRLDLDGAPLAFHAGQVALLGSHGQPDRRPYSIASSPGGCRAARASRIPAPGRMRSARSDFISRICEWAREIDLEGPFGAFTLPDATDAPAFLFIAGGTGISPLRSMIRHLIARGETRPISVLYSARTPNEFAYGAELRRLSRRGCIESDCRR